jgi:hypothetical protein
VRGRQPGRLLRGGEPSPPRRIVMLRSNQPQICTARRGPIITGRRCHFVGVTATFAAQPKHEPTCFPVLAPSVIRNDTAAALSTLRVERGCGVDGSCATCSHVLI